MVNVKKLLFTIVIIAPMLASGLPTAYASVRFDDFQGRAAFLAEIDTGQVLFEHNSDVRHPADSLTRIMTLLLAASAIDRGDADPSDLVEMTETAWLDISPIGTTQNIMPGEIMTLHDLMYAAFVGSANEASNLIAEHIAGSVGAFVIMMNAKARELGSVNTNFTNTHGQHNPVQFTTAADQFLIFREALGYSLFVEISSTHRYTTSSTNMSQPRNLFSTNALIDSNTKYFFRHSSSGHASITFEGGYSYIGFAETEDLALVSIVLGSDAVIHEDESVTMRNLWEARRLFEWGFANFGWRSILSLGELVDRIPVIHGAGADFVNLRADSSIRLLLDNEFPLEAFDRDITFYSPYLYAPIEAGEVLGEITFTLNGVEKGTVLLLANTSIELHRIEYIRVRIIEAMSTRAARIFIAVLLALILGYAALVVRYNVIRHRRLRAIEETQSKLIEERKKNSHRY